MKSVTEFLNHKLTEGLSAKTALAAEGKTPEEISAAIGEKFKFEGDRLKCFVAALDLAAATSEKIFRIKVVKLNEGQTPPPKSAVVEEFCYITELQNNPADLLKKAEAAKADVKGGKDARGGKGGPRGKGGPGGGRGGKGGKPKESPWGISPEEKAAKKAASIAAAKAAKAE